MYNLNKLSYVFVYFIFVYVVCIVYINTIEDNDTIRNSYTTEYSTERFTNRKIRCSQYATVKIISLSSVLIGRIFIVQLVINRLNRNRL